MLLAMSEDSSNITELLVGYGRGDKEALDQLMPIVYEELRRQAVLTVSQIDLSHPSHRPARRHRTWALRIGHLADADLRIRIPAHLPDALHWSTDLKVRNMREEVWVSSPEPAVGGSVTPGTRQARL